MTPYERGKGSSGVVMTCLGVDDLYCVVAVYHRRLTDAVTVG
jgi:hypothetical protein